MAAKKAVDTMAAAVREVDLGVENAQRAGKSINEIKDGSNTVVGAVEEISEAVREQSTASTSISQRIEQIAQMTDAMLVAQARWLPQYRGEIAAAKKRLAAGPRLGTHGTRG